MTSESARRAVRRPPEGRRAGTRLRDRRWFGWVVNLAVIAVAYLGIRTYQTWGTADGQAPDLVGTSLDGQPVGLAELAADGPVLVHFWATWCGVCQAEEDNIDAVAADHPVITVATRSGGASDVADYLQEHGLSVEAIADPDGSVARSWGVSAFPTSFVVDGEGRIRHVEVGYTTEIGLRTRLFLASL